MKFQSGFAVIAFFTVVSNAASVADCMADLTKIGASVKTLNNAINSFPLSGGSLTSALAIHADAVSLGSLIDKSFTDVINIVPNPVSEADSQSFLTAVKAFEPAIVDALNGIVVKKSALAALPIGGVSAFIKQDLSNLHTSTSKFQAALTACVQPDIQTQAKTLQTEVEAAFTKAIAAYA